MAVREYNPDLDNISFVLVETASGGNIGAAARAMKNMGLERLKLVNPQGYMNDECRMFAGRALSVVEASRVYSSLDEALAGENLVIGTTSARGRKEQHVHTPRQVAPLIREHARSERVGLIFGPERIGLTDAQLARCQYQVSIPASPNYPVLNLAQAVMVLSYEIFNSEAPGPKKVQKLATDEKRERMFQQMEEVLIEIGFLSSDNPHPIMRSIRRFLGRADLTSRDVRILRGIMSQMEWYLRRGRELPPERVRKP